jgi:AsmA protein
MRWIIRVAVGLALVVLIALGLLAMVPSERITEALSAKFEASTGRQLALEGEVRPRLWPVLGVTTGPVSIANADWAESEAPLFRAEGLSVGVNLGALLGGEVRITGLVAERPEINLERAPDGRANWVFGADQATGAGAVPAAATGFTLDEGRVRGATLRFNDRQSGRVIALDDLDAVLKVPDYAGPFTLRVTGLSSGKAVTLDLAGGVFSAFVAGRVVPVTLVVTAGSSKIGFDGRGGISPFAAEGAVTANLADLPALGRLVGSNLERPGPGLGRDRLTVAGNLTLDGTGAIFLRGAEIVADQNQMKGDLDLRPGEARPKLSGTLTAGPIVFGVGVGAGEAAGGSTAKGWSEAEIDVSALAVLDADLAVSAPAVDLGTVKLGETRGRITLERSRAVFDIRQMAAYGGQVSGDFVLNGRGGLSVGGRLSLVGMQTQPLLTDLAGWDRLIATGDFQVQFLGVGNSIAAIMASLRGEGALELGKGELRGLDIAGMLRTLDAGFVGEGQRTIFDALAGTFTIEDGVLSNSDLKLVAPYLTASGAGKIGLGARTLDYRIRPTALASEDGTGGVMVPLLITGPWANPSYRLDLESIARERMEAEAKAAEERAKAAAKAAEEKAKAELEARLKQELGIEVAPGETAADAAIRRAQEALEDEARRALEDILRRN